MRGSQTPGISQCIGQDETSFRIGIDNLDRLSGHRFNDISGALSTATRHVFRKRDDGQAVYGSAKQPKRPERCHSGRAAGHVVLHPFHAFSGLDAYAARIERDSFPNVCQYFLRIGITHVLQHHHAWRFFAALADAEQRAHFQGADSVFVKNFDSQANTGGHLLSAFCNDSRRLPVSWLIDESTSPVDRFARDDAFLQCLPVGTCEDNFFNRFSIIRSLIDLNREIADQSAFNHCPHITTGKSEPFYFLQAPDHCSGCATPCFGISRFRQSNENNLRGSRKDECLEGF